MGEQQSERKVAAAYRCAVPYCDRLFGDSYSLAEHLKLHAGEKRHICPVRSCGRRFSTPGNLSRHKRLHGPIKPLECPVDNCICTFRSENKLAKHMKFHLGSAVHVCPAPACGKTFSTAGNLNRHIKGHHPKFDVRAAKALMASQRESMRIVPPAYLMQPTSAVLTPVRTPESATEDPSTSVSGSDVDMSPSPASSTSASVFPTGLMLPASVPSSMVGAGHSFADEVPEKKPLGEMLDPVQLDMLVSLLDVETPTAGAAGTGFAEFMPSVGGFETDPRTQANDGWSHTVYPTPVLVLPASHGLLTDATTSSSSSSSSSSVSSQFTTFQL